MNFTTLQENIRARLKYIASAGAFDAVTWLTRWSERDVCHIESAMKRIDDLENAERIRERDWQVCLDAANANANKFHSELQKAEEQLKRMTTSADSSKDTCGFTVDVETRLRDGWKHHGSSDTATRHYIYTGGGRDGRHEVNGTPDAIAALRSLLFRRWTRNVALAKQTSELRQQRRDMAGHMDKLRASLRETQEQYRVQLEATKDAQRRFRELTTRCQELKDEAQQTNYILDKERRHNAGMATEWADKTRLIESLKKDVDTLLRAGYKHNGRTSMEWFDEYTAANDKLKAISKLLGWS